MLKLKTYLGLTLFALGVSTADSEWLIVPIALVALGIWVLKGVFGDECGK